MSEKSLYNFYQGGECKFTKDNIQPDNRLEYIKTHFMEFMNTPNVHFLLGSGTSADVIPSMKCMQKKVEEELKNLHADIQKYYDDLKNNDNNSNLEKILGNLYSYKQYLEATKAEYKNIDDLIQLIEETIFEKINVDFKKDFKKLSEPLQNYQKFYQKITRRNIDLSRVNVFTTNNDLFNETAMDSLNINFNNGFSTGLKRYFNPARFNITLSNKVDLNMEKYQPIENMINLYKLHGSINWIEDQDSKNQFFDIREIFDEEYKYDTNQACLIYPTPLKQNQSFGSPYADLIREFQRKLLEPNSVLIIIGFSMSDEHINNVIYQALSTNASLSIVILSEPHNDTLKQLKSFSDPRIRFIWGIKHETNETNKKIHFFDYIVNELLPTLQDDKEQQLLEKFKEQFQSNKDLGTNEK